jgi:hypothetical protein
MTNQLRSYETQVLLLGWCNDFPKVDPVNLFEIFSGAANTTKWWWLVCTYKFIRSSMMVLLIRSSYPPWLRHKCGFKCASFDFTYGQAKSQGNPMDFNQPAGFLYLGECSGSDQYYIYIENLAWSWLFYEPAMFIYEAMSLRHHAGVTQCVESDGSWLWQLGYPCQGHHTKSLP